ncbi:hypothetical protein G9464_08170 [Halostella sp. JP-L12]|nr:MULTISPECIES: hypothetical protein [Halostella]NHN47571.1 hypothetical protein [Halostella sp. JP-L12]
MVDALDEFDHPAWHTAIGTGVGYGIILVAMTAVLFGLPYALFLALG